MIVVDVFFTSLVIIGFGIELQPPVKKKCLNRPRNILGGGNSKIFGIFTPIPGKDDPIWRAYFSDGLKPPTSISFGEMLCEYPAKKQWMNRVVLGVAERTLKRLTGPSEPMEKPPTFGDGIFPKEVISSVTHVIKQFSGDKIIRSFRGRKDHWDLSKPIMSNVKQTLGWHSMKSFLVHDGILIMVYSLYYRVVFNPYSKWPGFFSHSVWLEKAKLRCCT